MAGTKGTVEHRVNYGPGMGIPMFNPSSITKPPFSDPSWDESLVHGMDRSIRELWFIHQQETHICNSSRVECISDSLCSSIRHAKIIYSTFLGAGQQWANPKFKGCWLRSRQNLQDNTCFQPHFTVENVLFTRLSQLS